MTTAQVVETSVTANNNSPIQDYVHPDDQTQPTFEMTPELKPFTHHVLFKEQDGSVLSGLKVEASFLNGLKISDTDQLILALILRFVVILV